MMTYKKRRSDFNYMKLCFKADEVIDKNQGKDITKWKSKSDILTLLKPLKTKIILNYHRNERLLNLYICYGICENVNQYPPMNMYYECFMIG